MSGHSKWSKIKRKKAGNDAARSKMFTRYIREISIAARDGGGDPAGNARLSLAIENAKGVNMPKENIERAIKKGTGDLESGNTYEEVNYEGYGPGGVAYFVETTTDNLNRTVSEIRHTFTKYGGNMGTSGSVGYLFDQKGAITLEAGDLSEDEVMLTAIDAGAEDIRTEGDKIEIITAREDLFAVRKALEEAGYSVENAELVRIPITLVKVNEEAAMSNFRLMEKLEESDDVSNVFTNMEMDDETMAVADRL
jgi:YebC/PmpR family DNA-binding regulatory protein